MQRIQCFRRMPRERANGDGGSIGDDDRGSMRYLQMQRCPADLCQASLPRPPLPRLEDSPRSRRVLSTLQRYVNIRQLTNSTSPAELNRTKWNAWTGSGRYLSPPKGACTLGTSVYNSGNQFYLDQCTRCTCTNSTVSCVRETCPVHDCPAEHQIALPGRCCPQCPEVEEVRPSCTYAGKTYGASIRRVPYPPSLHPLPPLPSCPDPTFQRLKIPFLS